MKLASSLEIFCNVLPRLGKAYKMSGIFQNMPSCASVLAPVVTSCECVYGCSYEFLANSALQIAS